MTYGREISPEAKVAADLGLEFSVDAEDNLVLHGPSRSVTIRRIVLYQVDDLRYLDPDAAINAAIYLFADE